MQGQTLAHYEILSRLGRGGMGEVYLARDTRLKREIALKILPPELAASPVRLKRFQREAETLAALSHPNIVSIYSVEEAAGVHFLTMELVKGQTLGRVIPKEGMSLERFFDLAIPLVDALTAAHARRVVHRDLKPSNIMITDEDRLRVLDFGLAKPLPRVETAASDISTAVLSQRRDPEGGELSLTEEGRVLGTAPYMSPEQANGLEVDHRTDLFSAGAIFYQMLTGRPPFTGSTKSEVMASILRDDPPSVDTERDELPRHLGRIVRKCLQKEPDDRYQASRDLGNDLEGLWGEIASGELEAAPVPGPSGVVVKLVAAAAVLVLAVAALWLVARSPRTELALAGELVLSELEAAPGLEGASRLSPDGEWVLLASGDPDSRTLSLRRVRGGEPIPATPRTGNVTSFLWSPDGERVAHIVQRVDGRFVTLQPAFGGPVEQTVPLEAGLEGAELIRWIGDRMYLSDPRRGLVRLDLESGESEDVLAAESPEGRRHRFDVSQNERSVLFTLRREGRLTLWRSTLDGRDSAQMSPEGFSACCARWAGSSDKHLVYSSNRSGQPDLWLMAVGDGPVQQITFSSDIETVNDVALDGGALTFRSERDEAELWLLEIAQGKRHKLPSGSGRATWPTFAEGRIVYQGRRPQLESLDLVLQGQLRVRDLGTSGLVSDAILVDDGALPVLSPSGERVAYVRRSSSNLSLRIRELATGDDWEAAPSFAFPSVYLFPSDPSRDNVVWRPDGRELIFVAESSSGEHEIRSISSSEKWGVADVIVPAADGAEIGDLHLTGNGRQLSYVRTVFEDPKVAELRIVELESGEDRLLYQATDLPETGDLFSRGWLEGAREVLILRAESNPDWTENLEVLTVDTVGSVRYLGRIDRAFGGSAQLGPAGKQLFLTVSEETSGVHNLVAYSLESADLQPLTTNQSSSVSLSGIEVLGPGRILFSQAQTSSGIWLVRFERNVP